MTKGLFGGIPLAYFVGKFVSARIIQQGQHPVYWLYIFSTCHSRFFCGEKKRLVYAVFSQLGNLIVAMENGPYIYILYI
jgi:hypothetical protein